jgi:hypothetical protein
MRPDRKARLWLCVPPVIVSTIDQGVTLLWQPAAYWAGVYSTGQEGNPAYSWLLRQHPLAFEAGMVAWVALFSSIIYLAPQRLAKIVSIAVMLGHTWGTATWLYWRLPHGYWISIALFLASATIIVLSWDRYAALMDQHNAALAGASDGQASP